MIVKHTLLEIIEQKMSELINLVKVTGIASSNVSIESVPTELSASVSPATETASQIVALMGDQMPAIGQTRPDDSWPSQPMPGDLGVGVVLADSESQVLQVQRQGLYALSLDGIMTQVVSLEGEWPYKDLIENGQMQNARRIWPPRDMKALVKSLKLHQRLDGASNHVAIMREPSCLLEKQDDPEGAEFLRHQMRALCKVLTEQGFDVSVMTPYPSGSGEAVESLDQILDSDRFGEELYGHNWDMEKHHATVSAADYTADDPDGEDSLSARGKEVGSRVERFARPTVQAPLPLLANDRDLLERGHGISSRIMQASGCFSLKNDRSSQKFLAESRFIGAEDGVFDALGFTDFGLDGGVSGYTLMRSSPRSDAEGNAIPFESDNFLRPRLGIHPATRDWIRDIDPNFPMVWVHDPLHYLMAVGYGLPAFHVVNGQGNEHLQRESLLRDLEALQARWGKVANMPQHLLIHAAGAHNNGRFDAMNVIAQELHKQGIDVLELHLDPSDGFKPDSTHEVFYEGLFMELNIGPLSQWEMDQCALGQWWR